MSRINNTFRKLKIQNEKALIPYIMSGYPNEKFCKKIIKTIIDSGADMLEIGFPFSDPLADGITIQNAGKTSLDNNMNINKLFNLIKNIRKETKMPLIVMTYLNIVYQYGYEEFISHAKKNGVDGLIIPDLPIEEAFEYTTLARHYGLDTIFLVAPNTSLDRIQKISQKCTGFLYLISSYGTTGTKININNKLKTQIKNIKLTIGDAIPLGIGFGISTPNDVMKINSCNVDAVIVGSALLKIINENNLDHKQIQINISNFVHDLKLATKYSSEALKTNRYM